MTWTSDKDQLSASLVSLHTYIVAREGNTPLEKLGSLAQTCTTNLNVVGCTGAISAVLAMPKMYPAGIS